MDVRVVRKVPNPPPIGLVVIELSVEEARGFVDGIALTGHTHGGWVFSQVARQIEEALSS